MARQRVRGAPGVGDRGPRRDAGQDEAAEQRVEKRFLAAVKISKVRSYDPGSRG